MAIGGMTEVNNTMKRKLSCTQQHLILKLYKEGPMQISKIAEFFYMKRPNATRFANELVKKGWCEKKYNENKSNVYLALTKEGMQMLEDDKKIARQYYIKQFEMHTNNEEKQHLLELYNCANKILSRFP